jgi:hypothetical protein
MKILLSSTVILIVTTFLFAQTPERRKDAIGDTIRYIKQETRTGGKLDFTPSEDKGEHGLYYDNKVAFNKKDYIILRWGQAVRQLGISSTGKASALWEEIYGRELTNPERTALRIGVERR